jgi:hypothetical protein
MCRCGAEKLLTVRGWHSVDDAVQGACSAHQGSNAAKGFMVSQVLGAILQTPRKVFAVVQHRSQSMP